MLCVLKSGVIYFLLVSKLNVQSRMNGSTNRYSVSVLPSSVLQSSIQKLHNCVFQNKIEGTIWKDIDDVKVFKVLDLEEFQKTFSAYQKPQVIHHTLIPANPAPTLSFSFLY